MPTQAVGKGLFASFPWYDLPEMHAATDALWNALAVSLAADGVSEVPAALDRVRRHGVDFEGTCLFTQTCGYPLFTTAAGHFTVLGAPCYGAAGCEGPLHRSFVVVRSGAPYQSLESLRGARFAINEADSNSGMNLPRRLFAPLARDGIFFAGTVISGSHAASAALVASGGVDAAAVDCVTFALLERYRPSAVSELRVLASTASTPAPPLVTAKRTEAPVVEALLRALRRIAHEPRYAELRDTLLLRDVDFCGEEAYEIVMRYEREAAHLGYPVLR